MILFRRSIRSIISFLFVYTGIVYIIKLFRPRFPGREALILGYHNVAPLPDNGFPFGPLNGITLPQNFDKQIRYLTKKCNLISMDTLMDCWQNNKPLPKRAVIITFDDGYKDNYLYAYPILRKYDVPATIFLTSGCINSGNLLWWDKVTHLIAETLLSEITIDGIGHFNLRTPSQKWRAISTIRKKIKVLPELDKLAFIKQLQKNTKVQVKVELAGKIYLSWEEIAEMLKNGVSFGSHTKTHPVLTKIPVEAADKEISESKKKLEKELAQPITFFSYPNGREGDFDQKTKEILKRNNFKAAVTSVYGKNILYNNGFDVYNLNRIMIGNKSFNTFLARIKLLS